MDLASLAAPQDASTPEERAQALRSALLGQQQMSVLNQATGNPYLAKMGQAQQANAGEQQSQLATAEQSRLERALRAQQIAQEGRYQQGELANAAQRNKQEAEYQRGELGARQQALEQGKFAVDSTTGQIYNTRTGELMGNAMPGGNKFTRLPDKDATTLDADLNAIEAVDTAKTARHQGVGGVLDYGPTANAVADSIAASRSGTGRATPAMQAQIYSQMPNYVSPSGDTYLDVARKEALGRAASKIAAHKQRGYDVSEQEARLSQLAGGAAAPVADGSGSIARPAPTHYSYSADRKQRIPTDERGNPVGPVEQVQ